MPPRKTISSRGSEVLRDHAPSRTVCGLDIVEIT